MKKFLIKTATMGGIVLLMFAAIELLLLTKTNEYAYKRQYIENHIDDIEILILGNSHLAYSVKPELVGGHCFNMAISGKTIKYDTEIAKKYVTNMKQLKCVFIPFDYLAFYFGRETWNPKNSNKPSGLSNTYKCMYYKYLGLRVDEFWYWSEILNSKLNYFSRLFHSEEKNREVDTLGFLELKLENRTLVWDKSFLPSVVDTDKPIDTVAFNALWNNYIALAELTKRQNARLVLLGTPMHKNAQQELNPKVLAEMKSFVENLKSQYQNVEYYDFTFDDDFVDDDFWDTSHIGAEGAPRFSRKLNKIVLKQ